MNVYLAMLLAWIDRAIAILEAALVTPTTVTQAERVGNLLSYISSPIPPATIPPRNVQYLKQDLKEHFTTASDSVLQVVTKTQPALESVFYAAYRNLAYKAPIVVTPPSDSGDVNFVAAMMSAEATPTVYALRVTASLFGSSALRQPKYKTDGQLENWGSWDPWTKSNDEDSTEIFLDGAYDKIHPGEESFIVLQNPMGDTVFSNKQDIATHNITDANVISRAAYGIGGKTTRIVLSDVWRVEPTTGSTTPIIMWEDILRGTVAYAQSEKLDLALAPITDLIPERDTRNTIELANLYDGLKVGQWLIVSGERRDIDDVTGVMGSELVMLAGIQQIDAASPDDHTHSKLILANQLKWSYNRVTVTVQGNVVKATHGETRRETLGSGDASQAFQSLTLKQPPLTFVSAPIPEGAQSTLKVYVNDVQWREEDSLADLSATDRKFITRTNDQGKTTVVFGNGQRGARVPTGIENVRAVYRNGIGQPGNVREDQISLLLSKPLGVKNVKNPLRASGGADKESRDTVRKNAPLTVTALDRLVSVSDYADFARTFAGIGKALAARVTDGKRAWVHVTIAGADDILIDESSDLYRNLLQALRNYGDPYQPIALQVRELKLLVISANVRILPEYEWGTVVKAVRAKLLDTYSFERRELGRDVPLSEVISVIQSVRGVAYVDVDVFGSVPEKKSGQDSTGRPVRQLLSPQEVADEVKAFLDQSDLTGKAAAWVRVNLADFEQGAIRPAQLAYLTPDVPDTLVLNEIK